MDNNHIVEFDLDALTIGDLERLESGSITQILAVFDHISGNPDEKALTKDGRPLRDLPYTALQTIAQSLREAVEAHTNPVAAGKN